MSSSSMNQGNLLLKFRKETMGMGGTMDSCGRCMKFSLICINVVTFIGGALALALGAWVWSTRSFSSPLMSNNMFIASVGVVVATGAAVMLLALLGCCGAAREVKCMLLTVRCALTLTRASPPMDQSCCARCARDDLLLHVVAEPPGPPRAVMMHEISLRDHYDTAVFIIESNVVMLVITYVLYPRFIIFVLMLVGGILQFVFREKVVTTLDREMYAAIPYYGVKHEYTKAWDETQTYLQCCGVKNYRDWNDNVPESCCKEVYPGKRMDCKYSGNPATMYMDGCLPRTVDFLRENAVYVGVIAIIVAFIMGIRRGRARWWM
ncbi:hypothetical protein MSG28_001774 [Choristoneura fumiferana]|uniref:Uncharacterized protein n=1 Tax=Choristoneura fumiferana TaxID=7141 RepID=A0ACC0KWG9_CHOFU|nr:hypothetical protein MSG28_001774 [Choristoneura fumiferana]